MKRRSLLGSLLVPFVPTAVIPKPLTLPELVHKRGKLNATHSETLTISRGTNETIHYYNGRFMHHRKDKMISYDGITWSKV